MNDSIIIYELKLFVVECGSQKEAAKELGISTQYLNDLLRGRRNVSEEIASKFGYKAEWVANGERLLTKRAVDGGRHHHDIRKLQDERWKELPPSLRPRA